ncbi:MAG: PilN domain-containing protein [Planctomycetota bacterium]
MRDRFDVVILLEPTRLEVVTVDRGMPGRCARCRFSDPLDLASVYADGLKPLDADLSALIVELGVRGARAAVLYASPDVAAALVQVPVDESAAEAAVELEMAEQVSFSLLGNCFDQLQLGTDRDGNGEAVTTALAIADADEHVRTIEAWLSRNGLTPSTVTPASVPGWLELWERVGASTGDEPTAFAYFGSDRLLIVGGVDGKLVFSRAVPIGEDHLFAAALSECGDDATLEAVAGAFHKDGIPGREPGTGLTAHAGVLPAIQPVLQRFAVELRQTLRFGFGEPGRARATITLLGPAAQIPGFAQTLSGQLEVPVTAAGDAASLNAGGLIPSGEASLMIELGSTPPVVRSSEMQACGLLKKIRTGLRIGTAAAAAIVALSFFGAKTELGASESARTAATARLDRLVVEDERWATAAARADQIAGVKRDLWEAFGNDVHWHGVLAAISRATPADVRFTELRGETGGDGAFLRMRGIAETQSGASAVSALAEALEASPLVDEVSIESTRRAVREGSEVIRFETRVTLHGVALTAGDLGRPLVASERFAGVAGTKGEGE